MHTQLHDPNAAVTRTEAATQLGVSPHTISMWVIRGWVNPEGIRHHITVLGTDGRQRLYRWGDLRDAERDTRNNKRSPRHKDRAA
jgi:DNA-binding transcriptional MerR regulator